MKLAKLLAFSWMLFLFVAGCDSYKETQQRKNYMIPKQHELPVNKKFVPSKSKKTYSTKKKKSKPKKPNKSKSKSKR